MSGPFIFIGTYRIKDGKLEEARKRVQDLVDLVERNEPRLIAFNVYLDEAGTRLAAVQVHPDPASMEHHLSVISDHLTEGFDYLESTDGQQVYGPPSETLSALLRRHCDPKASTTFLPVHEAGFVRPAQTATGTPPAGSW